MLNTNEHARVKVCIKPVIFKEDDQKREFIAGKIPTGSITDFSLPSDILRENETIQDRINIILKNFGCSLSKNVDAPDYVSAVIPAYLAETVVAIYLFVTVDVEPEIVDLPEGWAWVENIMEFPRHEQEGLAISKGFVSLKDFLACQGNN